MIAYPIRVSKNMSTQDTKPNEVVSNMQCNDSTKHSICGIFVIVINPNGIASSSPVLSHPWVICPHKKSNSNEVDGVYPVPYPGFYEPWAGRRYSFGVLMIQSTPTG